MLSNRALLFSLAILLLSSFALARPSSSTNVTYIASLSRRAVDPPQDPSKPSQYEYVCRPFGECTPCPKSQRNEPFCQPYGNRRLLHCVPPGSPHHPTTHVLYPSTDDSEDESGPVEPSHGLEIPAWEACGKVIQKEQTDFWEFITVNLLFFVLGTTIMLLRGKKLATLQYRVLAARIGIPGTSGGSRFLGFSL